MALFFVASLGKLMILGYTAIHTARPTLIIKGA